MVEYFPQILASDDKATTTTTIICSLLPFLSLNTEIQPMLGENKTISKQQQHTHKKTKNKTTKNAGRAQFVKLSFQIFVCKEIANGWESVCATISQHFVHAVIHI